MKRKWLAVMLFGVAMSPLGMWAQKPKYMQPSNSVEVRVDDLLQRMTLSEKIAQLRHIHAYSIMKDGHLDKEKLASMLNGCSMGFIEAITLPGSDCRTLMNEVQEYMQKQTRLGIPVFTVTESLHGSVHDGSTIFPQAIALGSTFNTGLAYEMTKAVAAELKAQGITQSLTPVIDVCRDLRWGRVEECFGEDPLLVSRMGVAQVKGYLDHRVSPMIKHFGAHAAPMGGLNLASVSCGQRDLLSVYLQPFETVVKEARPWAVMSSYNSWNNEPNSSSRYLMTDLLREQWGFEGYVYSDWGAIGMLNYFHKTARDGAEAAMQALTAGLDAEASDNCYAQLERLVEGGALDVKYIDQAVRRVLRAKFAMGLFEWKPEDKSLYDKVVHNDQHVALARRIAEESIVLLKNEQQLLPLDAAKIRSVALIGPNADQVQFGDYTWSRNNKDGVTLKAAIEKRFGNKIQLNYAAGCDLVTDDRSGLAAAVAAAEKSDVAIVVVGSASASLARDYKNATCGEGFDLHDLTLTGVQEELVKAVYQTGKPVVVVLLSGKPFAMPWIKANIPAVVVQWYPGEQGGEALADVLWGKVNPSGRLNYSFPQSVGHLPCYYDYLPTDKGFYRSPGSPNKPGKDYVFSSPGALWAFGHGLSYTEFTYRSLQTDKEDYAQTDTIRVRVEVQNTGAMDGKEVVQLYVRDVVSSVVTPVHRLKDFAKIDVPKGAVRQVELVVPVASLALYNRKMERVVEPGAFELQVGKASDAICLKKTITVDARNEPVIRLAEGKEKQQEAVSQKVSAKKMVVSGTIRDVQANLLAGITVRSGNKRVVTDRRGTYRIETMSNETLVVSGKSYQEQRVAVNGRKLVDIQMK